MSIYTRFNKNSINDRTVDTLIGLAKGMSADGQINQAEAEFLQTWLVQNSASNNPIIQNLLDKVTVMLEDGVLDAEEAAELFQVMKGLSGDDTEFGEIAKSASLPVCNPAPSLEFHRRKFLFTGTFAFGNRKACQDAITELGGKNLKNVTLDLDYLVLGTYVTDSWAHESYGRKIEKAMEYRDRGQPLAIISEEHWIAQAGL